MNRYLEQIPSQKERQTDRYLAKKTDKQTNIQPKRQTDIRNQRQINNKNKQTLIKTDIQVGVDGKKWIAGLF